MVKIPVMIIQLIKIILFKTNASIILILILFKTT